MRELAAAAAAGDWETMRALLSAESAEVLADLLDTADLWSWLETDPRAGELFQAAQRLVAVYDRYVSDGRLQSLWDGLLGRVELAPGSDLRRALETAREAGDDAAVAVVLVDLGRTCADLGRFTCTSQERANRVRYSTLFASTTSSPSHSRVSRRCGISCWRNSSNPEAQWQASVLSNPSKEFYASSRAGYEPPS